MDLSPDAHFLVTLSADSSPQVLSVWDCAPDAPSSPLHSAQVASSDGEAAEPQTSVRFDPVDSMSLVSGIRAYTSSSLYCRVEYPPRSSNLNLPGPSHAVPPSHQVSNGSMLVVFWSFHSGTLKFHAPSLTVYAVSLMQSA